MVVEPKDAVSIDDEDEEDGDPSLLDRVKSYVRKVFSPARY
jgi:hypothetical protein